MISKKLKNRLARLPQKPGVYIFKDEQKKILYIGKAANLKNRVRSYFSTDYTPYSPAKSRLVDETANIEIKKTPSEIEALILESDLIKKKQPKYNVVFRDDKNYFFVGITKPRKASPRGRKELPRIFITHQKKNVKGQMSKVKCDYLGPFTDGGSLKRVMRILREIFPYYTAPHSKNRKCTYCHIDLCPGPNPKKRIYQKTVRNIREILKGKRMGLIKKLKREMQDSSRRENFENAAHIRDQILALENVFSHRRVLEPPKQTQKLSGPLPFEIQKDLVHWLGIRLVSKPTMRIEGYDISNIQGGSATGSMVVFDQSRNHAEQNAEPRGIRPNRNGYRKFRIKTVRGANDVAMIKEVLTRRLAHSEWPMPDLILIDGGKAQLNAALGVINRLMDSKTSPQADLRITPSVISLAKREEEIYTPKTSHPIRLPKNSPLLRLLIYVRDEAHRFAIGYHRVLRKRNTGL